MGRHYIPFRKYCLGSESSPSGDELISWPVAMHHDPFAGGVCSCAPLRLEDLNKCSARTKEYLGILVGSQAVVSAGYCRFQSGVEPDRGATCYCSNGQFCVRLPGLWSAKEAIDIITPFILLEGTSSDGMEEKQSAWLMWYRRDIYSI